MMNVIQERDNMYILDDGRVRCFLFVADDEALLIDSGFKDANILETVKSITDKPVKVALTHGDGDHTGAASQLKEAWIHEKDAHMLDEDVTIHPIKEGDHLVCGDFDFVVIENPGHTYGSVVFADVKNGISIVGDSMQHEGPIFMFGPERNLSLYIKSLERLSKMPEKLGVMYPGHHDYPVTMEDLQHCIEDARMLRDGKAQVLGPHEFMPCHTFRGNHTDFFFNI